MVDMFPVLRVLGILIMVFALTMGLPLSVSWFLQDGVWQVYPLAMLCTLAFGFGLWSSMRLFRRELQPRHGVMLVTLVWVVMSTWAEASAAALASGPMATPSARTKRTSVTPKNPSTVCR